VNKRTPTQAFVSSLTWAIKLREREEWPFILDSYSFILDSYYRYPELRHDILYRLPLYRREQPDLVTPLIREALRDPELCEIALRAASVFPTLADEVVAALREPHLLAGVDPDQILDVLVVLFGLDEFPMLWRSWASSIQVQLTLQVQSELKRRYDLDLWLLLMHEEEDPAE
jgi:hypothetical protein